MAPPGPCPLRGPAAIARGLTLCCCLLVALAGCQSPAAHFPAPDGAPPCRSGQLTRQLLADSAVELVHHPGRVGRGFLLEPLDHLAAARQGLFGKRLLLHLRVYPPAPTDGAAPLDPDVLEARLHRLLGTDLQPAHLDLYPDGPAALGALKELIDQATCAIDVLMFQWEDDPLGETLAEWLAARAGPELRVRVLVDGGGNLIFGHDADGTGAVNRTVDWLAQQPYVEVLRGRNPFARFDHRKLVLVDDRVAWSGGRNFTQNAFFADHDLSFTLTGPLVADLQDSYERRWCDQGGKPGTQYSVLSTEYSGAENDAANASAHVIRTEPTRPHLAQAIYQAVDQARCSVYVENYCLCDSRLLCKLAAARRRGVDVRVVMPRQAYTHVMSCSNRVTVNRLLRAGVRVYLYPAMMHVKAALVDGCWAYLGSGNYDALSLRHNRETGLAIGGGPVIQELYERLFAPDFRPEWEVTKALPVSCTDYACELLASLVL